MNRLFTKNKLFISQWYIGSGNIVSVFSRRPDRPFEEIKELYLIEIESAKKSTHPTSKISVEQRKIIKEQVKKQIRKQNIINLKKRILALLISIVLFIGLIYITFWFIEYIRYYIQTYG